MRYKIEELDPQAEKLKERLSRAGIRTTDDLLRLSVKDRERKAVAEMTGLSDKTLKGWISRAKLMRVEGIGRQYAELLIAAGVDSPRRLVQRNAAALVKDLRRIKEEKHFEQRPPGEEVVGEWIARAKKLPALSKSIPKERQVLGLFYDSYDDIFR